MEQLLIEFAAWFVRRNGMQNEIIALDGKRVRGSNIHLLHVLATRCGIVLAQIDIDNKNNESIEISNVLDQLDITGAVVTAHTLNCQKPIAKKIREKGADYFLSLKGNQGSLFEEAQNYFVNKKPLDCVEEIDKAHGCLEIRRCWSTSDIEWLTEGHSEWRDLKSICCIERERHIKGNISQETAFYISSTEAMPGEH